MSISGIERLALNDGRHLTVEKHTVFREHPLHWHSYFEIEIVLSGSGKYVINDVEYDLSHYNVFFLSSTDFHYLTLDGEAVLINLSFDEEILPEEDMISHLFMQTENAFSFDAAEKARLISAAELLMHECSICGDGEGELLRYVLKCIFRKSKRGGASSEGEYKYYKGIKKAITFMQMHFKEDITLSAIAAEAGYHPTYFSELYKRVTGEGCTDALARLRVRYARTMLANGFSVSDACFLSGFGSLSNFTAVFKRLSGVAPSEYRKTRKIHTGVPIS